MSEDGKLQGKLDRDRTATRESQNGNRGLPNYSIIPALTFGC